MRFETFLRLRIEPFFGLHRPAWTFLLPGSGGSPDLYPGFRPLALRPQLSHELAFSECFLTYGSIITIARKSSGVNRF